MALAFAAHYFLRSVNIPLTMYNIGNVESGATLIYLGADKRLAAPASRFMFQGIRINKVDASRFELSDLVDSIEIDIKRYADLYVERTAGCLTPLDISSCLAGGVNYLDAHQAQAAGITTGDPVNLRVPSQATWWWICD